MQTQIEFYRGGVLERTVIKTYGIPNLQLGQTMTFDHSTLHFCLRGSIVKISHVIFLVDEPPITYVDVQID